MDQLFQVFSLALCAFSLTRRVGFGGEHDPGQSPAIDTPVRSENRLTPTFSGGRLDLGQPQYLMPGPVCVQHPGAKPGQVSGNQALAACYAAQDADKVHGVWTGG